MCLYRCFRVCLFILYCLPVTTGQSNLICSSEPVAALAGSDVILPCRLEPPTSASSRTVEWTRPGLDPEYIHVHQDGRLVYQSQNPLYNYRTALFVDQLINGNVSLKLLNVKISDAGRYKCFLPWLWKEAFIQLGVGAVSSPVISLKGTEKPTSGVILECKSKGWYPEPEVSWLDGEGNLLPAGPTETVRGPDGLYTVSSRVTVEKRHSNSFTCRVQQQMIKQMREAEIYVPDDFFKAPCSCVASISISIVLAVMFIPVVVIFLWKWRQNKTNTEVNQEHETEEEKNTSTSNKTPLMKKPTKAVIMGSKGKGTTHISSPDSEDSNSHIIVNDLNGHSFCLSNTTSENQLLSNWKVHIELSNTSYKYRFIDFTLEAGKMVTIWASDSGRKHNPPTDIVWKEQKSWGTQDLLRATLTSPMGEKMNVKTLVDHNVEDGC